MVGMVHCLPLCKATADAHAVTCHAPYTISSKIQVPRMRSFNLRVSVFVMVGNWVFLKQTNSQELGHGMYAKLSSQMAQWMGCLSNAGTLHT